MKETDNSRWSKVARGSHHGEKINLPDSATTPVVQSPNTILSKANGPQAQIFQTNHISTPVLLIMLAAMILSIAIAAVAIGIANQAERQAQNAEREARVAMNHADLLDVDTKTNAAVIQTLTMKQAVREAVQEK